MGKIVIFHFRFVFIISVFWGVPLFLNAQGLSLEEKTARLDSISKNPSGIIYFLNKKEISELDFYKRFYDGEFNAETYITGDTSGGRNVIMRYGERYRHGILIITNPEKKKENEK